MGRNVVVCCDGTANEFAADRTNVLKLFHTLEQAEDTQIVYYHPGLGTMEAPGALTGFAKKLSRLAGLAFGAGLERDVRDAYVFLMNNFQEGDRLFMFGFSRGAYTVRALASMLKMYGLLPKGNDAFVPYAIRMLRAVNDGPKDKRGSNFALAAAFRETFKSAGKCKPYFVGVWDTVSSVGWVENPLHLPYSSGNSDIEIGRHAIAIDERRAFFRTNLWRPGTTGDTAGPQDLRQIWFPGVHCDVGGGYPESESDLSRAPLTWMLDEAIGKGLLVDPDRHAAIASFRGNFVDKDGVPKKHESLTLRWWPAELIPKRHYDFSTQLKGRRFNFGRRRKIPTGALVHRSAYLRGDDYRRLLPLDVTVVDK